MSEALTATKEATPKASAAARPGRRVLAALAVTIFAAAAVAYGIYWVTVGQYLESTDDAYVGGNVTALAANVSGPIAKVAVTDNQFVRAGQLIVQIDDRPFRAALARAQAGVAGSEANVSNLAAARTLQLSVIEEAKADVQSADAELALAAQNQARYARLAASNAGSVQDSQTANSAYTQAQAATAKARAALTGARTQLAVIGTQQDEAAAALKGAKAALRTAQLNLGYTQIRAPVDGYIGDRAAQSGGYAQAGAALVSIVPAQGLWVDANFKEDQLARMRPGQHVRIIADILPGRRIIGHVASLAPATGAVFSILPPENATGNFTKIVQRVPVRILLDGNAATLGLLRPGLSVTATVDTK